MKKNIAYYLEDPERLSEISLLELNQWVEEMPYSQPLRLLVDMKSEKNTSDVDKDNDSYGVYFAQDYEPLSKKETKILAEKNINKAINEDQLVPVVPIPNKDAIVGNSKEGSMEAAVEVPPIVTHSLVDDVSEDTLEDDLLEINPNVVVVNEVSHEEADEVLEAELENEVLEISLEEVEEVTSFSALDSMLDTDKVAGVEYEEDVDDVDDNESENTEGDRYAGLVDYKSFVVGVSTEDVKGDEFEVDEIEEDIIAEVDTQTETKELEKELIVTHSESYETTVLVDSPQKTKKEKKSKKKDKKNKKKKASKKKEKTKKEEKKKKSKAKKSSDKEKKKVKTKKKSNSKELKSSKNKTSSIKKVKGEITNPDLALKSKSVKGKAKKIKKEVKYVVVNEATTNDFKLKDYDGVSKFTNWLLEKKSINGNLIEEKKETETLLGEIKDKKKKKKKKNKVLKVAQDSVKKSEMILSEPLANIMAAQGHTKKAKKMYKQLGLIFPEKSGYFAMKIENLKKK